MTTHSYALTVACYLFHIFILVFFKRYKPTNIREVLDRQILAKSPKGHSCQFDFIVGYQRVFSVYGTLCQTSVKCPFGIHIRSAELIPKGISIHIRNVVMTICPQPTTRSSDNYKAVLQRRPKSPNAVRLTPFVTLRLKSQTNCYMLRSLVLNLPGLTNQC